MEGKSCSKLEEPEISPITVKNGCDKVVGYDYDFVESPADDLLCKICHYPARDPILAVCCGQSFCSCCLERYRQSKVINHSSCPYCRDKNFQTVPDKRTGRCVLNLKVFCPHKYQGCEWIGELRSMEDHMNKKSNNNIGCPFTELQCSNGCGVVMQRRLVEGHLKSECELREVNCEYCNTRGSYQWINSSHHEKCLKYPVECPNHCEVGHVRREEMGGHLEECPLVIVECPYVAVGCESVVRRKEQMEHVMRSVGQHMEYNKNAILATQESFQKRLDAKEQQLEKVRQDLQATKDSLTAKMQSIQEELQITEEDLQDTKDKLKETQSQLAEKGRELDEVRKNTEENNKTLQGMIQQLKDKLEGTEQLLQQQLKANALQIETIFKLTWSTKLNHLACSNNRVVPFISKLDLVEAAVYRIKYQIHYPRDTPCVHVVRETNYSPNIVFYTRDRGYKMCLNMGVCFDRIIVAVELMEGDHDDHLSWPVRGTLTVQLLNQISDSNHSKPVEFIFNGSDEWCHRIKEASFFQSLWKKKKVTPQKTLVYTCDKNCWNVLDNCVFLRVCNFQSS